MYTGVLRGSLIFIINLNQTSLMITNNCRSNFFQYPANKFMIANPNVSSAASICDLRQLEYLVLECVHATAKLSCLNDNIILTASSIIHNQPKLSAALCTRICLISQSWLIRAQIYTQLYGKHC